MKYERLTRRNTDGTTWVKCAVCDIQDKCDFTKETCCQELQDRLAELEDKIEQGTLKEIPELPKETVLTADDIAELLTIVARETRKETAEKFAERLKTKLCEFFDDNEDNDGKIDKGICLIDIIGVESLDGEIISLGLIDEICKEITGVEENGET